MRGPRNAIVASKKPLGDVLKPPNRNTDTSLKEKATKKNSGAPKRPVGAFFVFMEEFRKSFKENFPENKSIAVVGKAGGEKWKSLNDSEKAPYLAKAAVRKSEYKKALINFQNKLNGTVVEDTAAEDTGNSSSEVHDGEGEVEQELSS
ncbi:hypothetical protein GIB67_011397 [Kingdonia uniflora]|uniref:HMG box domain-containing protein n=1 Tax=Kingdonia uniflora TaxID=39325 RepID=A0A7J7NM36_9MAGN|nr:hypothetical protein GIB67_011397 [Kingdonia uniflora]